MFHYIDDKVFLKRLRGFCSDLINQLVIRINNDDVMRVRADLVGSGARNLIMQNEGNPIDLDYNLCILECFKYSINDGRRIKEYIQRRFNEVLNDNHLPDCNDSKAVLTTKRDRFEDGNQTQFSIDLGIVREDQYGWHRLIHEKTGNILTDKYVWNLAKDTKWISKRIERIKSCGKWELVRVIYHEKKNYYLRSNDYNHPSFIVYIESVNEAYHKLYGNKSF